MKLYHGSNMGGIKILEPKQADHDRPYVYMTTIDVVAGFYLCNAVEKPYYWFPYGFDRNSDTPVYHELFLEYIRQGKMRLGRFEDKTEQQLDWWYSGVADYMAEKDMVKNPDCSYAVFVRKKLPQAWEKYLRKVKAE